MLLLGYLAAASIKDIKKRTVSYWLAMIFGFAAIVIHFLTRESHMMWLSGVLPGIFLLMVAWLTHQSVGYGDGCVMLVIGLFLGASASISILMIALLVLCPISLVLLIWSKDRKKTLPFVPFLLAAYMIWLIF